MGRVDGMKSRLIVFFVVQLCFAFIAWCYGYNFDERGNGVGFVVALSIIFGLLGAGFPGLGDS